MEEGGESTCNKSLNWFNSAVADGCKIQIGQSDNCNWGSRPPFYTFTWCNVKMTDMKILSRAKALADLNVVTTREFTFKPEQEVAVRALLNGIDALAVLKSLLYQMYVRNKESVRTTRNRRTDISHMVTS